jgi:hypothetical protein
MVVKKFKFPACSGISASLQQTSQTPRNTTIVGPEGGVLLVAAMTCLVKSALPSRQARI